MDHHNTQHKTVVFRAQNIVEFELKWATKECQEDFKLCDAKFQHEIVFVQYCRILGAARPKKSRQEVPKAIPNRRYRKNCECAYYIQTHERGTSVATIAAASSCCCRRWCSCNEMYIPVSSFVSATATKWQETVDISVCIRASNIL